MGVAQFLWTKTSFRAATKLGFGPEKGLLAAALFLGLKNNQ